MKTIGILGGLGPQATMDFVDRLHRVSQQLIPPQDSQGYPPTIVYYCRFPPFLLDQGELVQPIQPEPRLLQAAQQLGALADFLVIPSNSTHLVAKAIAETAGCPLLNMIDVTLDELKKRGWQRVGVAGFRAPTVYTARLAALDIEYIIPDHERQAQLDHAITCVMEGRVKREHNQIAAEAMLALRAQHVDGIIFGCTEIPLLLDAGMKNGGSENRESDDAYFLNPAQLLAEAAVVYAKGNG